MRGATGAIRVMRIVSLDALRGIAALSVAIPHFFMSKYPGNPTLEFVSVFGVEVFFILSGFVLAPQILFCLEAQTARRFGIFVVRRWMRTLPPYIVALTVVAILSHTLFGPMYFKYLLFIQNLVTIDLPNDYFAIAWSLSVEEWFYIVFPIYMIAARYLRLSVNTSLLVFFALFFSIRIGGALLHPEWHMLARRLVMFRLDSIAFGFALYVFIRNSTPGRLHILKRIIVPVTAACIAGVSIHGYLLTGGTSTVSQLAFFYSAPAAAATLLLLFYFSNDMLFKGRMTAGASSLAGELSYDIYLFHLPIIIVIEQRLAGLGLINQFAIFLASLLAVSFLMRMLFEQPILDARPRYERAPRRPLRDHEAPRTGLPHYAMWCGLAVAALCLIELGSYGFIKTIERVHPEYVGTDFSRLADELPEESIRGYARYFYNRELGWSYPPSSVRTSPNSLKEPWTITMDAEGSRAMPPVPGPKDQIAIYGDSFAASEEVSDNETFQYYLSLLIGAPIKGYGTGAYGPDQALYRLERDLKAGHRYKIVIFGIHTENIKNVMSAYRIFQNRNDGHVLGFKPVLVPRGSEWEWVRPELDQPEDRASIAKAVKRASANDHFYRINQMMPQDKFPYSLQAIKYLAYLTRINAMGLGFFRPGGGDTISFWKYKPALDRMNALADRFVALGHEYKFVPVLVMFAEGHDIMDLVNRKQPPPYAPFLSRTRQVHRNDGLIVVDTFDAKFDPLKLNILPMQAHHSPYGNRVTATAAASAMSNLITWEKLHRDAPNGPETEPGVDPWLSSIVGGSSSAGN